MRRYGLSAKASPPRIAAGGTLGAMLPPSTVLPFTASSPSRISQPLHGRHPARPVSQTMYMATIAVICRVSPDFCDRRQPSWAERLEGLRRRLGAVVLFVFVIGGLYGGVFTPTERAASAGRRLPARRPARAAGPRRDPRLRCCGHAHRGGGVHRC